MELKQLHSSICERAASSHYTPRLIIQESQTVLSQEAVAMLTQYKTMQRNMQRKRKVEGEPTINPNTVSEITFTDALIFTLNGENFLLHDSGADDPD